MALAVAARDRDANQDVDEFEEDEFDGVAPPASNTKVFQLSEVLQSVVAFGWR